MAVVLPRTEGMPERERVELEGVLALLEAEPLELEAELGAPVVLTRSDPGVGPRFLLAAESGSNLLRFDRRERVLRGAGCDAPSLLASLNALRSLSIREADVVIEEHCHDLRGVTQRIMEEVGDTYPAFALRDLDWKAICARHVPRILCAAEPLPLLQEWLAELQDMHTSIRSLPPSLPAPYVLKVEGGKAYFHRVPEGSAAHAVGVQPGDTLLETDALSWWKRTGAPLHARSMMAGYRLLAAPEGTMRVLRARSASGEIRAWRETWSGQPPGRVARWERRPSGAVYLRIENFRRDLGIDTLLAAAFHDLHGVDHLIVDLRGNVGGSLEAARAFRNRFLHERTLLGSIRFSVGGGRLSRPQDLYGEPISAAVPPHVSFLTDALTYSAAEDALLGLQGLPHIRVIGQPSGGGSGRPRTIRLRPDFLLTVSTALTYDRSGRCVEGAGIPVDYLLPDSGMEQERAILAAESIPWISRLSPPANGASRC